MKPGKIIFWILFAIVTYQLFDYVKTHTRGDVVAYKRFARSLMERDDYVVKQTTFTTDLARQAMGSQAERDELFEGVEIVFTYYRIHERKVSEDGKSVHLSAEQVSRVNPEGMDKLWGARAVRIPQSVRMVLKNDAWLVAAFNDPAMRP